MGEALSIVAIVVLLALAAYSLTRQRAGGAQARAQEEVRTAGQDEQRDRSLRRRAEARDAHLKH